MVRQSCGNVDVLAVLIQSRLSSQLLSWKVNIQLHDSMFYMFYSKQPLPLWMLAFGPRCPRTGGFDGFKFESICSEMDWLSASRRPSLLASCFLAGAGIKNTWRLEQTRWKDTEAWQPRITLCISSAMFNMLLAKSIVAFSTANTSGQVRVVVAKKSSQKIIALLKATRDCIVVS